MDNKVIIFDWKLFFVLWAATIGGLLAVIPYTMTLQSAQLASVELPMPLWMILILQIAANSILFGLLAGLGLFLAKKISLGLPYVSAWIHHKKAETAFRSILYLSIFAGALAGLLILGLDRWVFDFDQYLDQLGISIPESTQPPPWQGFLASFYGGITEEVLMRLFLLSFIAWIGRFLSKDRQGKPGAVIFWVANILAALIFGLGHLPATAGLGVPLDFFVVSRALALNGIGGLVFGWLYWKNGLESAMIAHFSADIVLHVFF